MLIAEVPDAKENWTEGWQSMRRLWIRHFQSGVEPECYTASKSSQQVRDGILALAERKSVQIKVSNATTNLVLIKTVELDQR